MTHNTIGSWMGSSRGPSWGICLLFALIYWGPEMMLRDLWEPDEARFAYVADEMMQEGHLLVPHRNSEGYAHKPPLQFWLNQGFANMTGGEINRVTTRLPSVVASATTLYVTSRLALLLYGGFAGWFAPLLLASSFIFWKTTGMGQMDALLLGLQSGAMGLLIFSEGRSRNRQLLMWVGAYLLMGLAILTKGPVGFLIPYGSWICFTAARGQVTQFRKGHLLWGPLLALLLPAMWLGAMLLWEPPPPGFLDELLFKQNLGRVDGSFARGHIRPFWYFLKYLPVDFMPWTLLMPAAVVTLIKDKPSRSSSKALLGWLTFVVLFFSLPATKRNLYILSAYPALAILLAGAWERRKRLHQTPEHIFSGFLLLLGLVMMSAGPLQPWLPHDIPLNLWLLFPSGLLFGVCSILLWMQKESQRWLTTAIAGVSIGLVTFSALIYPAMNPVKVPYALAAAAKEHPPSQPELLLYRMHGEIQALNAKLRGHEISTPEELDHILEQGGHHLMVIKSEHWHDIQDLPQLDQATWEDYSMGSKTLRWVAFDLAVP